MEADRLYYARRLLDHGTEGLLADLHPSIRWSNPVLSADYPMDHPIDLAFPAPSGRRATLISRNPARPDEVIGVEAAAAPEDVDEAVGQAGAAARTWAAVSARDRMSVLRACAEVLRRRRYDLAALEIFEDLHADPLAARAATELRASGETARKRDPSTLTTLTAMERQVAQLVSQGLSNKDVAVKCWIHRRK